MNFFKRNKPQPKSATDLDWLKGIHILFPQAFVCFEARPLGSCKTISAVVLPDLENETTTIFVNFSMQWLPKMGIGKVMPEMKYGEETLSIPQLVIYRENMYQFNQASEAHLILAAEHSGTYIAYPWEKTYFHILQETKRWIFWSLADEEAKEEVFYWGLGKFEDAETFDRYIAEKITK